MFCNTFRFSSEYADDTIGLVYYNYRHFNPWSATWLCRDKEGENGSANLYSFCFGYPFNTDSLGLKVDNKSKCPVVIKPENDHPRGIVVRPGGTYSGEQDGVYRCCNNNPGCVVYKTVDHINVTVTDDGIKPSGGSFLENIVQRCIGGCKGEGFLADNTNWPTMDEVKELCDEAGKK